jgi:streptogrisin D
VRNPGSKLGRPIVGLAAVLLVGSAFASPASAAPVGPAADPSFAPSALSSKIDTQLGAAAAGSYVDSAGKVVVNVTDAAAAKSVSAAGAIPRYVTNSGAALAAADATLKAELTTPGTSFGLDPVSNKIVVTADSTVTGAKLAAVKALVAKLGDKASFEAAPGTLRTTISGGDAIYTGGSRCSLGFNVRNSAGTNYFLTAGHCTNAGTTWTNGSTTLGTRAGTSFPGNDYGIVRYTTTQGAGTVYLYNGTSRDITAAGSAYVGQSVLRRAAPPGSGVARCSRSTRP